MTITIKHMDAMTLLNSLKPNTLDAVITDPPYSSGATSVSARKLSPSAKYSSSKNPLPSFYGEGRDQLSQQAWLTQWMVAAERALKPGGVMMVFTDWRQSGITATALQMADIAWRGKVIWHKPTARPQKNAFRQETEEVLWGTKGSKADREVYLKGFYSHSMPATSKRHHLTEKPLQLMKELLAIVPEKGCVCDPFSGSGTTAVAAMELGLNFIGSEKSKVYFEVAKNRIADVRRTLKKGTRHARQ